jgi:hypothetical protein
MRQFKRDYVFIQYLLLKIQMSLHLMEMVIMICLYFESIYTVEFRLTITNR